MAQKAKFNINTFFDKLFNGITEGRLVENVPVDEIYRLLAEAKRIFASQPMLLKLGVPINICGDLHGQFNDLMRIMDSEGFPHVRSYLFLGDYVDRGAQSVELILFMSDIPKISTCSAEIMRPLLSTGHMAFSAI
ncbi:Serine/threonine protein phosphatase [Meloidogyne graminicola]|uniref:Serine/threonine protein phosphatase n=1 Tax=Meloidogyne graminicola TaxID=189291 RepID=A0A8S9ZDU6_9BILA|nr:Serine/threonine protein phosphatase [Meloidogyne graminicola]